jgi:hypothetical protein
MIGDIPIHFAAGPGDGARLPSRRLGVRETDDSVAVQYRGLEASYTVGDQGVVLILAVVVEVVS